MYEKLINLIKQITQNKLQKLFLKQIFKFNKKYFKNLQTLKNILYLFHTVLPKIHSNKLNYF